MRRLLFHALVMSLIHIYRALKKKEISKLIDESFRRCGLKETVVFGDKLMQNGYALATRAGISFCSDDMLVPAKKYEIISAAEAEVKEIEIQYTNGLVTNGERYNKVVDIWGRTGDQVAKVMMDELGQEDPIDRHGKKVKQEYFNSILSLIHILVKEIRSLSIDIDLVRY